MSYPALNRGPWAPLLIVSCTCILVQRPDLAPCLASPASFPAACLNRTAINRVMPCPRSWVLALDTALVFCPPASAGPGLAPLPPAVPRLVACLLFLSAAAACRPRPPPVYLSISTFALAPPALHNIMMYVGALGCSRYVCARCTEDGRAERVFSAKML